MKKILILMMTIVALSSCSNDDNSSTDPIVGEWRLVKGEYYSESGLGGFGLQTIDYSDKNIIYDFGLNNKLIISGEANMASENRVSDYLFEEDYLSEYPSEDESKTLLVKIDGSKWIYSLTDGTMILGQSYIDGGDLYFERK